MWGRDRLGAVGLSLLLVVAGCHGSGSKRVPAQEPSLSGVLESDSAVAEAPPARSVTFVDRHPLFSKPRDYWESAGDNKLVKAGAATFIGVPVGIYGEMKQIVVGTPTQTR